MGVSRTTPIIVGIGEVTNKHTDCFHAIEPADLMVEAIRRSMADASIPDEALAAADSILVVPPWTWAYPDLPRLISEKLRIMPEHRVIGSHGGDQPAYLCDEAARRISTGGSKLAIITGGEALASLAASQKAGITQPQGWSKPDSSVKPISTNDLSIFGENAGTRHSLGLAIHVYPMYENGLRADMGQSKLQNNLESAKLYSEFDRVACSHPSSWRFGETPRDAESIGSITKRNRLICTPYPLLMNAFNTVNLAAACILTSVEHAEHLGIPKEKWVYILGGAGTHDKDHFWERSDFHSSQSLEQSIDAAITASELTKAEIDCYDIYSCFPVVPKLACRHLGLSVTKPSKPITVLGGLTSFGGAGNNYSMHAIIEMTRQLRDRKHDTGLVLANGGLLTHHHSICLSTRPRKSSSTYPDINPLPTHVQASTAPPIEDRAEGTAFIETYTVEFDRQGCPRQGYIVGRLERNGHRFVSNHGDAWTLQKLVDVNLEPIGLRGIVTESDDGRNLFYLKSDVKL